MKKSLVLLLLVVLGLSGFYLFQQHQQQTANLTELKLYGNVDIRDVSVGVKVAGRVNELFVDEGDQVKQGNLLARLDQKSFQDELALAKAKLAAAEAVFI